MRDTLAKYGIFPNEDILNKLENYCGMLIEKNKVMDLTNVPDAEIPERHFADSLLPAAMGMLEQAETLADIGTGAGFPGMAIAIMRPEMKVTLIDAQEKRCAFLREVKERLQLDNVSVLHMRAEDAGRDKALRGSFDICTARAVAALDVLEEYLLPLLKKGGSALCWKGPGAAAEMAGAVRAAAILKAGAEEPVQMPMPGMQHYIVRIRKLGDTPAIYPRKNGTPSRSPLGREKEA